MEARLETNQPCTIRDSLETCRITALELGPDPMTDQPTLEVAVECPDGVHWFGASDITSTRQAAQSRILKAPVECLYEPVTLMSVEDME